MDQLFQMFGPARMMSVEQILCSILVGFVLSMAVATVYRWTYQGLSYSRSFVHTQVLGAVVSCVMIMAIGNNLARGLGIVGTLAIIRFRTPIRDPRDIIFLFMALAIGIATGSGVYAVAIIGTSFFCLAALYLHLSPFASRREYEGLLRYMRLPEAPVQAQIEKLIHHYCVSYLLVAMREAVQGDMIEYSYQIRLSDPSCRADLIKRMNAIEGVSDVGLLMQRSTVEI